MRFCTKNTAQRLASVMLALALAAGIGMPGKVFAQAPDGTGAEIQQEAAGQLPPEGEEGPPTDEAGNEAGPEDVPQADADTQPGSQEPARAGLAEAAVLRAPQTAVITGLTNRAFVPSREKLHNYNQLLMDGDDDYITTRMIGDADSFTWSEGIRPELTDGLLATHNIQPLVEVVSGDVRVGETVLSVVDGKPSIQLTLHTDKTGMEYGKFEVAVYLKMGDARGCKTTIRGFELPEGVETVDSGANNSFHSFSSGAHKLFAAENVRQLHIGWESGKVNVKLDMKREQLYSLQAGMVAEADLTEYDRAMLQKYPHITDVVWVKLSDNAKSAKVWFDVASTYHIYRPGDNGRDPVLLGRGEAKVSYFEKYYLAAGSLTANVSQYGVEYLANGADSGEVPVDATQYYLGQEVITKGNPGNLARTGYVFGGWSTEPKGSGNLYSVTMPAGGLKLYANWRKITGIDESSQLVPVGDPPLTDTTFAAGSEIRFPIHYSLFEWYETPEPPRLTTEFLKTNGIRLIKTTSAADVAQVELADTDTGVDLVVKFKSPARDQAVNFTVTLYCMPVLDMGLSGSKISVDIQGTLIGTGKGGSSNKGGSGGGGGGGGYQPPAVSSGWTVSPSSQSTAPQPVSAQDAVARTQAAVSKAASGSTAAVRVKDASHISLETMKQMAAEAKKAGGQVVVRADNMVDGAVAVRIAIDPAKATKDITLTASTDSKRAEKVLSAYQKAYKNQLQVISFDHQGSFGQVVRVTAKVELKGAQAGDIVLYSYDKTAKTLTPIEDADIAVDSKGNLRFSTGLAGDIIVSNGVLEPR